jgi:hypothetical protein
VGVAEIRLEKGTTEERELFRAALRALEAENGMLAAAFQAAPEGLKPFYARSNLGLAHWVYETQLVYTIFKAWIPLRRTRWESPIYEGHRSLCKADCRSPGSWGQRPTFSPGSWGHRIARVMGPGSRVIGPWIARVMGPVDRQGHGASP